jgi:hypothetical protein
MIIVASLLLCNQTVYPLNDVIKLGVTFLTGMLLYKLYDNKTISSDDFVTLHVKKPNTDTQKEIYDCCLDNQDNKHSISWEDLQRCINQKTNGIKN